MSFFITLCDGFIYHNHIVMNQPYMVNFQKKSSKDIKIIDNKDAHRLASFWYGEMKHQQEFSINNERQRIECLYRENNEDYEKIDKMTEQDNLDDFKKFFDMPSKKIH